MWACFTYFRRLVSNIFSILLKMLLQLLKFIQHFPEIFVKFSQNVLTIISKPFLTFFTMYAPSIKYISQFQNQTFSGEDHWRKLSSPPCFNGSYWWRSTIITVGIVDYYFSGDRQSLFWQPSGQLFQLLLATDILAAISDSYFGSDLRLLVESFARPHWRTVKTFVFAKKSTIFGSRRMVDRTLHAVLIGLLLLDQIKCSHHVHITLGIRLPVQFVCVNKALNALLSIQYLILLYM